MNNQTERAIIGTVLIVDDAPENLAVLSDMLSEAGCRVLVATDGLSALEQIGYLQPDLILLDVMMPGIDGFETCRELKKQPATRSIPIIFMTGLSELDDLLKGFGEGAVDYIVKPVRPPEVLARVEVHLARARDLQRVEAALNHLSFAAFAFDGAGRLTWLTPAAASVIAAGYEENDAMVDQMLPQTLLQRLLPLLKAPPDAGREPAVAVGSEHNGRLVPCGNGGEFMLLLQKRSPEWDLDSLKNSFGLTPREAEILMWISRGKTNKEVGLILETSPRTVNKHLEHVFEKLGVPTRTAAVAKVMHGRSDLP